MSLKDVIVQDVANIFQNTDDFAIPITVVNEDGTISIDTDAQVFADSDTEENASEGTFNVKLWRVFISTIDAPSLDRTWHLLINGDKFTIVDIGEDDLIAGTMLQVVQDVPKERFKDGFRRIRR